MKNLIIFILAIGITIQSYFLYDIYKENKQLSIDLANSQKMLSDIGFSTKDITDYIEKTMNQIGDVITDESFWRDVKNKISTVIDDTMQNIEGNNTNE